MPSPPDEGSSKGLTTAADATPTASAPAWDADVTAGLPGGAPGTLTFARDEGVAGRYRIVRFIARGGMGEVYEAEDLELGGRVALKTVRPDAAGDRHAIDRFKREIHLARQVTHPNVCRIFDLSRHPRAAPDGDVLFLTMELLPGETLADRIRHRGRLATSEALPVVEQVASALAAAHLAGVTHRDFKSSNVMLVPSGSGGGAVRAVVTDFGLAHRAAGPPSDATLSATAKIVGTPAYMAPEQVAGRTLTAAVDIYALGVVMYEMVTGRRPFTGDSSFAAAVKRLSEPPSSPRNHVPDLDPVWETVILTCLRVDPADRYASAEDVARALRGERLSSTVSLAPRQLRRRLTVAVAAIGVLGAGAGYWALGRVSWPGRAPPTTSASALATRARPSVAVLGFRDLSRTADSAWLSAALSEMLVTELSAGERIRTIPGQNVARMKTDLSLGDADTLGSDTLARIGTHLGTDRVVVGSYLTLGTGAARRLRLDLRIQDTSDGETVASVSETGTEAELFDVVSRAGAQLRARLGATELSETQAVALRASIPSSPEAARAYAAGLEKLRVFDAAAARKDLEEAVRIDPSHPLFHSALAEAWSALGYDARARDEAKKAFALAKHLSREDRLAVEARYRETMKEWDRAVEIRRTLWNFFPDNLEYGLRLAAAESASGRRKEGLATLEALRKLPAPAGDDPRIDLAEAGIAYRLSDFARQRSAAERAGAKAEARAARLLIAEARLNAGDAAGALGDPDRALALYEEARLVFDAASDRSGVARTLISVASVRYRQGRLAEAGALYQQGLEVHRETGNEYRVAWTLHSLANVSSDLGDLDGSRRIQEQALAIHRRIGDRGGEAGSLGNIASLLQYQGDLAGARRMHEEALAIFRELGEKGPAAIEQNNIAIIHAAQGDLARAESLLREALALKRETGNRSSIAFTLSSLGDLFFARGDLAEARKQFEEAAAIRQELGQSARAAESRLALATLDLEAGRAGEAEAAARQTAEEFRKEKMQDPEGAAQLLLARSALAQGRADEAKAAVQAATSLLAKSQDRAVRLSLTIDSARVDGLTGTPGESARISRRLLAAAVDAARMGHVALALEARLALAEIEARSGRASSRDLAVRLAKDAGDKGFGLIAKKATALAAPRT